MQGIKNSFHGMNIEVPRVEMYGLQCGHCKCAMRMDTDVNLTTSGWTRTPLYETLDGCTKKSAVACNILVDDDEATMLKYARRWYDKGITFELEQFKKQFQKLYKICHITKYRDFQYRRLLGFRFRKSEKKMIFCGSVPFLKLH